MYELECSCRRKCGNAWEAEKTAPKATEDKATVPMYTPSQSRFSVMGDSWHVSFVPLDFMKEIFA